MSQIGSDLRKRTDISILKSNYGKAFQEDYIDWTSIYIGQGESVRDYRIWLFALLHYVFDECNRVPPSSYLLWICYSANDLADTENAMVLDFFLRRVNYDDWNGKFLRLQNCLEVCEEKDMDCYAKRFLDAGAHSTPLNTRRVNKFYISRLETRAAIYAFLHCRLRRSDLRAYAPRDIWKMIAQMVWNKRFDKGFFFNDKKRP